MHVLADTTINVSSGQLIAITLGIVLALGLQVWALVETVTRHRWLWLVVIWVTFPVGTLAWLTYGRRRPSADV